MVIYAAIVVETVATTRLYVIQGDSDDEAREKAAGGGAVSEADLRVKDVANRVVERVEADDGQNEGFFERG